MSPHAVVLYLHCSQGEVRACIFYSTLADVYVVSNITGVMLVDTHWDCQSVVFRGRGGGWTSKKVSSRYVG